MGHPTPAFLQTMILLCSTVSCALSTALYLEASPLGQESWVLLLGQKLQED